MEKLIKELQNKLNRVNKILKNNYDKLNANYPFQPYVFSITFDDKPEVRIYKQGYFYGNPMIFQENSLERSLKLAIVKLKKSKIQQTQIWL